MCEELEHYYFFHNGHRVDVGPFHNKYEAAEEFRNRYGYYPQLDSADHHLAN